MKDNDHYNIFESLKNDFEVYGELLDVGCGECLTNLLDFENTPFDLLIGLDSIKTKSKDHTIDKESLYRNVLMNKKIIEYDPVKIKEYPFVKKFEFIRSDLFAFDYKTDHYGLIICTGVLHFFCDEIKYALISLFYKAIKKKGLIFIRLNHSKHPNNTDPELSKKICHNIYQTLSNLDEIRYLIDEDKFIERMKCYNMLEQHTSVTNKTVTIVIKK